MSEQKNKNIGLTDSEILDAFNKARASKINVIRPKFMIKHECFLLLISFLLLIVYCFCLYRNRHIFPSIIYDILRFGGIVIFILLRTKEILLIIIFIYQRFAPASIRSACLYQPCCSEYMRKSIIKYGVCKGTLNGIRRIRRCRPPNCGIDEP